MSEALFGIHGAALEVRSKRMNVLASNIANAATPGYKARDVDFAAALDAKLAQGRAAKSGAADLGASAGSGNERNAHACRGAGFQH